MAPAVQCSLWSPCWNTCTGSFQVAHSRNELVVPAPRSKPRTGGMPIGFSVELVRKEADMKPAKAGLKPSECAASDGCTSPAEPARSASAAGSLRPLEAPETRAPDVARRVAPCDWCGDYSHCGCEQALLATYCARAVPSSRHTKDMDETSNSTGADQGEPSTISREDSYNSGEGRPSTPHVLPLPRADWWSEPDLPRVRSLAGYRLASKVLASHIVPHPRRTPGNTGPWNSKEVHSLYASLGMRDSTRTYLAVWLNLGDASILFVSEVLDPSTLEACLTEDFLVRRLMLLPGSMNSKLPFPSPSPAFAQTVGGFWGLDNVSYSRASVSDRAPANLVCIQVDLYSSWYVRVGLQRVFFHPGNEAELLLVDYPARLVVSGLRICVNSDLLQLLSGSA